MKKNEVDLTVRDIPRACGFYGRVLGMEVVAGGEERMTLACGPQKINLKSRNGPGSLMGGGLRRRRRPPQLRFVTYSPRETVIAHLRDCHVEIEADWRPKSCELGPHVSIYFRDPDGNRVEVVVFGDD